MCVALAAVSQAYLAQVEDNIGMMAVQKKGKVS